MRNRFWTLALLSLVLAPCIAARADDTDPNNRVVIQSKILGEERVALVRRPLGYDKNNERYPVLYMTDGASHLGHTAATIEFLARNGRMPEMIVVAITNTDRDRDLTPTNEVKDGNALPHGGGADKFLQFIQTELIPKVEQTYRTQPYRLFAGHSFGGLLAVHALVTKPDLFNVYIAGSPSLRWDNEYTIHELEEFLKSHQELQRTLILTVGGDESGRMRLVFDKAKELLSHHPLKGFVWDSMILEGEDHGTVVLRSQYFALKKTFDDWRPSEKEVAEGMPAVEEHYKRLSAKYHFTGEPPERLVDQIGFHLMKSGKSDEAIAMLKKNTERFPNSASAFAHLAHGFEITGKLDLARTNYDQAIELGIKRGDPSVAIYKIEAERVSKALKDRGAKAEK